MNVNERKPGQQCRVRGHTAFVAVPKPVWEGVPQLEESRCLGGAGGLRHCLWYFITGRKDLNPIRYDVTTSSICTEGTRESDPYLCDVFLSEFEIRTCF